ncbi:hypothetical protein ACLB2K_011486 [Fragaria x ananassa]
MMCQKKYLHTSSIFQENYKKPSNCSHTWSGIVFAAKLVNRGLQWRIGNARAAKFWVDKWSQCGILADLALDCASIDLNAIVKDFWVDKMWNSSLLLNSLPFEVVDIITAIPIFTCDLQDNIIWGGTPSGNFTIKCAYKLLYDVQMIGHVEALSWFKPAVGFHKLNVDGSRTKSGEIGAGGVIKDSSGCWSGGFMINIGTGEVLQAEAWGLFKGIQMDLNIKISKSEVESDSAVLVNLLQNSNMELHPSGIIVTNCRSML